MLLHGVVERVIVGNQYKNALQWMITMNIKIFKDMWNSEVKDAIYWIKKKVCCGKLDW